MLGVLMSDWIKMRKTWVKILVVLGPFGVVSLNALHYGLSYNRIVRPGGDNWGYLIGLINSLLIPALVLGIAILASLMAGLEHQGQMWKQLLAMPVPRFKLYASKFIWLAALLACSGALVVIGTAILGLSLGFGTHIPWTAALQEGFYPYLAAYTLVALQLLLSVVFSNQAFGIIVGVLGVIASFAHSMIPRWMPWGYPMWASPAISSTPVYYASLGVVVGLLLLCVGAVVFTQREVK